MNDEIRCHDIHFLNVVLSQFFHSALSSSSRGSLVRLQFLPWEWYNFHIWGCWCFSWQSWIQLVSLPSQHFIWCTLHIEEGNGNPFQDSCLENSMDGGTWWATVHGVAKSWTWVSSFTSVHFTLHISLISRVTVYRLDILLSQFWTSPLFHVWF